ncbi:hypothetical protein V7147_25070 [Bacillus sp. JJ1521]|uniref:hypothetical protein n=1 Tax=Bacillus sp. JJ1521 TaxID=3122957 RepID=UPI002FFDF68A
MLAKLINKIKAKNEAITNNFTHDSKTIITVNPKEFDGLDNQTIYESFSISLPNNLRGRSIHLNVIPTVCNLKNMLEKLELVNGDFNQLKQWEKRSYKAYQIDRIKHQVLAASPTERIELLRNHILLGNPFEFGASCIDIYLVAFVAETIGPGKQTFIEYIRKSGISEKENSAQAIWQVGKGDGVYLGLLSKDGSVKDWDFFAMWTKDNREVPEKR